MTGQLKDFQQEEGLFIHLVNKYLSRARNVPEIGFSDVRVFTVKALCESEFNLKREGGGRYETNTHASP